MEMNFIHFLSDISILCIWRWTFDTKTWKYCSITMKYLYRPISICCIWRSNIEMKFTLKCTSPSPYAILDMEILVQISIFSGLHMEISAHFHPKYGDMAKIWRYWGSLWHATAITWRLNDDLKLGQSTFLNTLSRVSKVSASEEIARYPNGKTPLCHAPVTLPWLGYLEAEWRPETRGIDVSQHAESIFEGPRSWGHR